MTSSVLVHMHVLQMNIESKHILDVDTGVHLVCSSVGPPVDDLLIVFALHIFLETTVRSTRCLLRMSYLTLQSLREQYRET
jgi:hypothetical protein